jgi:Protein of unknown function (DUF1579)
MTEATAEKRTTDVKSAEGQPAFQMPQPTKEHEWLKRFVGEWESDVEVNMPGQPTMTHKGTESAKMVGGFWTVIDIESGSTDMPYALRITLGYDPAQQKYIGAWIDSMSTNLGKYEGTVDATGNILTLNTEANCPMQSSGPIKFKEVTEFKGPDEKVFTSSMLGENGEWQTIIIAKARRKK